MENLIARRPRLLLIPLYFISIILTGILLSTGAVINNIVCPHLGGITLYSTPAEIIECFGPMDIASYVRGAFALQEHGLKSFGILGFATWPPGFSFLELALIQLDFVPLPLALFFVNSTLWAIVFFQLYALLTYFTEARITYAVVLPLLLLLVPFVSGFYLWTGILMSEPISTALFMIAVLDLWRLILSKVKIRFGRAAILGLLFALAAYLRAQFDLIIHAMAATAFFVLTGYYFYFMKTGEMSQRKSLVSLAKSLVVILLAFQVFIIPYKTYMVLHGHGIAMADVSYIFERLWRDENWHARNGAAFFSAGGGHSMCAISPLKCQVFEARRKRGETISLQEYRSAAFETALTQPIALLNYKWSYLWKNWKLNDVGESSMFNTILFFLILTTALIRIAQRGVHGLLESLFFLAICGGATIFSFIVHFEPRYLLLVKLFGAAWALVAIADSRLISLRSRTRLAN